MLLTNKVITVIVLQIHHKHKSTMINDLNQNLRVIPFRIKIGDKKRPVSKHWPKAIRGSLIKIKLKNKRVLPKQCRKYRVVILRRQ
jgi:hypothetical protein